MWDLIKRIFTHPKDYVGLLKRRQIVLKERIDEGNGVMTFIFQPIKPLSWHAGQHALFFPRKPITGKQYRVFSIASASHEEMIEISTNIPPEPSPFKQHLLSLQPGDQMVMRGPIGEMYERADTKRIVAVAGGVGITPFRALLAAHAVASREQKGEIHLIYASKNDQHLYQSDLERYAADPTISIEFVTCPEEVNAALDAQIAQHQDETEYHISGSPGMITAIGEKLEKAGITRIINDPFKGY